MNYNLTTDLEQALDEVLKRIENKSSFCLHLNGDLGSGKTFFVKNLIRRIYPQVEVYSPTYTLVNLYQDIYHLDLYRVEEPEELEELGIDEMEKLIIEWPKQWKFKSDIIQLDFSFNGDVRMLKISP